jgi:hypothetical protein
MQKDNKWKKEGMDRRRKGNMKTTDTERNRQGKK